MTHHRRTEIDIMVDILKLTQDGSKKTRILYQANLNQPRLNKYLNYLMENGLLEHINEPDNYYKTTEKGKDFLDAADAIKRFF